MKNTLLILSIGLSGMVVAQNVPNQQPSRAVRVKMLQRPCNSANAENSSTRSSVSIGSKKVSRHFKKPDNITSVSKIFIGTAENMFGILTANNTQVTGNPDLNMIAFTHRESNSLPFGSGAYQTDWSIDRGNTWDTAKAVVFEGISGGMSGTRYPNGVILNPAGNTTPSQAYAITSGPHTNSTAWDSVAFGSIRLDSTYRMQNEVIMYPNVTSTTLNVFSPPQFLSVTDDSVVHSIQYAWTLNTGSTLFQGFYGAVINKGIWSGATHSVTWTSTVLKPHFVSSDGPSAPVDSDAELGEASMAWSQDGSVGYVVFFGNLDSTGYDYVSLQPVVYKSTDHGNTWNMMPMFNFATIPSLVQYLIPTLDSANVRLPLWDINGDSGYYAGHDIDMTVDMNNNLHIFGAIESGAIANPDSGGYTYNPSVFPHRYIYDVYTVPGGWQANLLDSLVSPFGIDEADASAYYWYSATDGALLWGARIQASRTKDGSKVFCTWVDDFTADYTMLFPDIASIGIDVTTNSKTQPTRFTTDGTNYFLDVSDIAMPNGSCWDIPCVVAADPGVPDAGTTPVEFFYVQGITLCDSDFGATTVPEVANSNTGFSISQNYPNPFSNITRFNVKLAQGSMVSVDVFNMVGQKVYSINSKNMVPGNHLITLDGTGWNPGVYFYRVTVNNQTVTKKMVVQ